MSDTAFSLLQYRIHSGVRYCIELLSLWPLLIWNIFMALLRQFWRMLPLTFLPQYNTPSLWVCVKHCTQSTCPSLVMLILITWVMFCSISPLYHYFKKKKISFMPNQAMQRHFKTMFFKSFPPKYISDSGQIQSLLKCFYHD